MDISSKVARRLAEARPGAEKMYRSINKMALSPDNYVSGSVPESMNGGAKRRGVPVKTLKKILKKAGLKTSGKKAALTRRAKKAKLMMKGGEETEEERLAREEQERMSSTTGTTGGRKRKSRGKKGMYGMGGLNMY
jgi:hypothetical protein